MHVLEIHFYLLLKMSTCFRWGQSYQVDDFTSAVFFTMGLPLESDLYSPCSWDSALLLYSDSYPIVATTLPQLPTLQ